MGDPAGIGGETALMAWHEHRRTLPPFFLFDDPERLHRLGTQIGMPCPVAPIASPGDARSVFQDALPVMALSQTVASGPGDDSTADATMTIESIDRAVDAALSGQVRGVVTSPVRKSRLYEAGFTSPGHTEYLGALAGLEHDPVMMLVCSALRVVPVTVHLALREAISVLSGDRILHVLETTWEAARLDLGLSHPRLAVAGLNPHAGEDGHLGREEIEILQPAIETMRQRGADIVGPLPADTMFHAEARETYDIAVCMYHDQALIPLKTLDFHGGVNVTLGLPFVRTSPDHGTAYDIAGTGAANPGSFIAALQMADDIAACRARAGVGPGGS